MVAGERDRDAEREDRRESEREGRDDGGRRGSFGRLIGGGGGM